MRYHIHSINSKGNIKQKVFNVVPQSAQEKHLCQHIMMLNHRGLLLNVFNDNGESIKNRILRLCATLQREGGTKRKRGKHSVRKPKTDHRRKRSRPTSRSIATKQKRKLNEMLQHSSLAVVEDNLRNAKSVLDRFEHHRRQHEEKLINGEIARLCIEQLTALIPIVLPTRSWNTEMIEMIIMHVKQLQIECKRLLDLPYSFKPTKVIKEEARKLHASILNQILSLRLHLPKFQKTDVIKTFRKYFKILRFILSNFSLQHIVQRAISISAARQNLQKRQEQYTEWFVPGNPGALAAEQSFDAARESQGQPYKKLWDHHPVTGQPAPVGKAWTHISHWKGNNIFHKDNDDRDSTFHETLPDTLNQNYYTVPSSSPTAKRQIYSFKEIEAWVPIAQSGTAPEPKLESQFTAKKRKIEEVDLTQDTDDDEEEPHSNLDTGGEKDPNLIDKLLTNYFNSESYQENQRRIQTKLNVSIAQAQLSSLLEQQKEIDSQEVLYHRAVGSEEVSASEGTVLYNSIQGTHRKDRCIIKLRTHVKNVEKLRRQLWNLPYSSKSHEEIEKEARALYKTLRSETDKAWTMRQELGRLAVRSQDHEDALILEKYDHYMTVVRKLIEGYMSVQNTILRALAVRTARKNLQKRKNEWNFAPGNPGALDAEKSFNTTRESIGQRYRRLLDEHPVTRKPAPEGGAWTHISHWSGGRPPKTLIDGYYIVYRGG